MSQQIADTLTAITYHRNETKRKIEIGAQELHRLHALDDALSQAGAMIIELGGESVPKNIDLFDTNSNEMRMAGAAQPKLKLTIGTCGDCWLHIEAPSGLKASISLGQRDVMIDQTIVGRTIREVAQVSVENSKSAIELSGLGQKLIAEIVRQGMFAVQHPDPDEAHLFVWAGNADEQLECVVADFLSAKDQVNSNTPVP